jgi:two-component system, cell cycle response regulator
MAASRAFSHPGPAFFSVTLKVLRQPVDTILHRPSGHRQVQPIPDLGPAAQSMYHPPTGNMSSATAALRIAPTEQAVDTLERVVTSSSDPAVVAAALLDAAAEAIPCSGGAILLRSGEGASEEVVASTVPEAFPIGQRLDLFKPARGARCLSLRAGGEEFGQIVLLDARKPGKGGQRLIEQILVIGSILQPLAQVEKLRNRVTETNAIVEVGQVLTGMLAMEDVLSYVIYLAESLVAGNSATIALLTPDKTQLLLKNSTGNLRIKEGDRIPVDSSLMGWVARTGQSVNTPNSSTDPRSHPVLQDQGPGLVVPLQMNGETTGVFLVGRLPGSTPFTDENLMTLQKMAAYAAISIQNAHLYHEQTQQADTLREQAVQLQSAYSKLNTQQEQLIVSEKMAALGRITAGIAHEINSPLGGIMNALRTAKGYAEEYRSSIGDPEITSEDHQSIAGDILNALTLAENASTKVAQFVRSIKTQTRPGEGQKVAFDPAAEVDSTIVLLQHRFKKENVGVYTELEKGLVLTGDSAKFALVLQNLISNAIDAYEGEAGEIWVRLKAVDNATCVEVIDRGCGIPEEIRGRIFDYLFTTKDVGKGTGLGLAMVHSVVTNDFGGQIELDSVVGSGTTFRLISRSPERTSKTMARKYQSAVQSGHTILIIDDSPDILESCRQLLEAEGHRVVTAVDGKTGLVAVKRERPSLIIVDYFMPEMTGEEVVRRIRQTDRNVQIILATGYAGEKPARVMMQQLDIQGYHDKGEGAERLLLWVDSALKAYRHVLAMEKHRIGLQYILDITPDLHRLQPLDELLQGLLWQVEGLVGAENSFLATFSSEEIARSANSEMDGFVALVEKSEPGRNTGSLAIRVGTGRFRTGIPTAALPETERQAVERAVSERQVSFQGGVSVVPLRLGEDMLGVIYIDRRPGLERDRDLLEIFAAQAASAIQSALLYGQNALLFDLATKDPITGVYLRGYAMQQFQQHLKRSHRNNLPVSALMVDLDHFKQVNDTHGHVVGDNALRALGELLRDTIRETDCVARYGGDEFLIVLPDTPAEGARMVGQRLVDRAKTLMVATPTGKIALNLSVGCGTLEPLPDGPNFALLRAEIVDRAAIELVASADASLYKSKHSGTVGEACIIDWSIASPPIEVAA